jgi:hypothetical protein
MRRAVELTTSKVLKRKHIMMCTDPVTSQDLVFGRRLRPTVCQSGKPIKVWVAGSLPGNTCEGIPLDEAAFFPGALYLLPKWYTKKELGLRNAILFCGNLLGNAFGGLLAAGMIDCINSVTLRSHGTNPFFISVQTTMAVLREVWYWQSRTGKFGGWVSFLSSS